MLSPSKVLTPANDKKIKLPRGTEPAEKKKLSAVRFELTEGGGGRGHESWTFPQRGVRGRVFDIDIKWFLQEDGCFCPVKTGNPAGFFFSLQERKIALVCVCVCMCVCVHTCMTTFNKLC